MVMDQWEVCCLLGCWELLMKDRPSWFFFSILFHVVLPSRPSTVLQTFCVFRSFKSLLSRPSPRLLQITLPLLWWKYWEGQDCLKVVMVFNLHQWWFISSWPASHTDLKTWNRNYYLLLAHHSLTRISKGGGKEVREKERKKIEERKRWGRIHLALFFTSLQSHQSSNPICQACGVILKPVKCTDRESCHFSYGHMVTISTWVIYRSPPACFHYYKEPLAALRP